MNLHEVCLAAQLASKGGGNSTPIDTQVNGVSENAVQNKAIYDFLNSSVANNTAYFKGTYNSVAELETIVDATNNDYAFVVSVDANGNTVYNRYKYSDNEWLFEYALNNSSFTANQWDTINSGVTSADIQNLQDGKVDKVAGKQLSTNDFTDADKSKLDSLENYDDTDIKDDIAKVASQAALNQSTLGYQRKNLLKNTAVTATQSGVTFTVNEDKSVTVNGTATSSTWFKLSVGNKISAGRYKITSGIDGYGTAISVCISPTTTYVDRVLDSTQSSKELSSMDGLIYAIRVQSGYTFDNVTVYPMLLYADIVDETYEPHKPSVEERLAALEEKLAALEGSET